MRLKKGVGELQQVTGSVRVQREQAAGNAESVEQEGGERRRGEESQGRNYGFVKVAVVNAKSLEHLQYVNLHNYFSHSSLATSFLFPTPPIKLKLGLQIGGRLPQ
jgi:hypothetical protein